MCRQDSRVRLSAEEEIAAAKSFSAYCKPVELCNLLQQRATRKPSFLQRCLRYKIQAKHKRRIQMTVLVSEAMNGRKIQSMFPLYIMLARSVSNATVRHSAVYRFRRACMFPSFNGTEAMTSARVNFILPDIDKLSKEVKSGSLAILLVSCAGLTSSDEADVTKGHMDLLSGRSNFESCCLMGKIPLDLLYKSWEKSPNLSLGERAEMMSSVIMQSFFMKLSCVDEEKSVSFQFRRKSEAVQLRVIISAEEVGANDLSPYNSYPYNDYSLSSLSDIIRVRNGNVLFNYKYYNNKLQRAEATEDFTCAFCLVKCASFKGLQDHLCSSHDLFNFEFWVTEECQAVNVSLKTDTWTSQMIGDGVDPRKQTFFFCSKPLKRREPKSLAHNAKYMNPLMLDADVPAAVNEFTDMPDCVSACAKHGTTYSRNATGLSIATAHSSANPECVQSVNGSNLVPPAMLQFAKRRKLSAKRSYPRNLALLQKRRFFHSHRAQPMALEEVCSNHDSEGEVADNIADLEDRRMLDDFLDVTKYEKQVMHLWNSFVRKQRVLADGHIPWACEAFSNLHGKDLVLMPNLLRCWRVFMVKLWNHGLLDARTITTCNDILDQRQIQCSRPARG